MSYYYRNARQVTVYSGNFDWLNNNDQIQETIQRLVKEKRIYFVSAKNTAEVESAIGPEMYNKIRELITFFNSADMRGSIILYEGNVRIFIYRYQEPKEGNSYICAIRDFGQGRFLLNQIFRLIDKFHVDEEIIIICGKPGSGKSVACERLTRHGYERISAGDFFRQIVQDEGDIGIVRV